MPASINKNVTFRSHLKGEIDDLLRSEGVTCAETCEAIVTLSAEMAHYHEEGVALFPEVFICDDINDLTKSLSGAEIIKIGEGVRSPATALKALKECAPLAIGGWSIYLGRGGSNFTYGVFRSINFPLSMTPSEILTEDGDSVIFILEARKISESCVELKGGKGNRICLFFSAEKAESPSPEIVLQRLSELIVNNVADNCQIETQRFIFRALSRLLPSAHGALIAVIPKQRSKLPDRLGDAVILEKPIEIASRVSEFMANEDVESLTRLQATEDILKGMLGSDGILLFRSDGSIFGYRAFLRPKKPITPGTTSGGARRRAYDGLKEFLNKPFSAVFFRSQDGHSEIAEAKNE